MEERLLINSCKKGDAHAQKALFEQYGRGMLLLCRRYIRDYHHAEEVLLNGFQKFFQHIERFEYSGKGSIGAWLKKIIVNECLLFLRQNSTMVFSEEADMDSATVSGDAIEKLSATEILNLIGQLPEGYRLVFNLYVIEGYTHREISEILNIAVGTSKSQFSKARAYLQELLQKNEVIYER